MSPACCMKMKRKLMLFVVALLGMLLLTGAAMAAENPIKVAVTLSQTEFTGPANVDITIKITNAGSTALPGPITLYYPDGKQVEDFGEPVLGANESKTWTGTWGVTEDQLQEGKITFRMTYSLTGDDGNPVSKTSHFSKAITYKGDVVSLEVNRTITPLMAGKGTKVTVTYDLINTGTAEITNVSIKENRAIATKAGTIDKIAAGQKASYTFTANMGTKNLTSKATITFTAAGEKHTVTKEEAVIKYGEVKLTAALSADKKGGTAGETVKLTLTLKNSGKTDYTDLTVTDPNLGEMFTVDTVAAGKTVTLEKEITLDRSMDILCTVNAKNAAGDDIQVSSERLSLTVIGNDQLIDLHVEATVDSSVVYIFPSIVKFRVYVTNNSTVDVTNVSVSASGMTLYTFPSILAGETREFTRDVKIEMAGQYQFVAACLDKLNQSQSFNSNIVYISYSSPTPVPTEVPIPVPAQPTYVDVPTSIENPYASQQVLMGNVGRVCLIVAIVAGALSLVGILRRVWLAIARKKALETLDDSSVRNYEAEAEQPAEEEVTVNAADTDPDPEDLKKITHRARRADKNKEVSEEASTEEAKAGEAKADEAPADAEKAEEPKAEEKPEASGEEKKI